MKPLGQAISSAALVGVLSACLLLPAVGNLFIETASAAAKPISGELDRAGLMVVALAPHGRVTEARARPRFRLVPAAGAVTLQLRDRSGAYLGPVVVEGRRGRVKLGVRAGAKLGLIKVRHGYGRVVRRLPRGAVDGGVTARARRGVPLGVGSLGWVAGRAHGARAPGLDPDRDGIPDKFDVDDDGNLVIDARQAGGATRVLDPRRIPTGLSLGACPAVVCSAHVSADLSNADRADVALVVAVAAAVLAALSLALQLLMRRSGSGRVEVDVRLGLPIYHQGRGDWAVFIEVLNKTDHPMRWVSAALELADGRRLYLMQQPPGGELPAVLQPHDSHQTWAPCRELERAGLDLSEPIVATAKLDSGEILRSPRRRLLSRSVRRRWRR
jgi:hypothetical protein